MNLQTLNLMVKAAVAPASVSVIPDRHGWGATADEQMWAASDAIDETQAKGVPSLGAIGAGLAITPTVSRGMAAAGKKLQASPRPLVRGLGSVLQFGQRGLGGSLARMSTQRGMTRPLSQINTHQDYLAARTPGLMGRLARAPQYLAPDMTVPAFGRTGGAMAYYGIPAASAGASVWAANKGYDWWPTNKMYEMADAALPGYGSAIINGVDDVPALFGMNYSADRNEAEAWKDFQGTYDNSLRRHVEAGDAKRRGDSKSLAAILSIVLGLTTKGTMGSWLPGLVAGAGLGMGYGAMGRKMMPTEHFNGTFDDKTLGYGRSEGKASAPITLDTGLANRIRTAIDTASASKLPAQ